MRSRLFLFCLFLCACGDTHFGASDQSSIQAGHTANGVTLLCGSPSMTEVQAMHQSGVVVRITNALQYPDGADAEPTRCHLSARLCAHPPRPELTEETDEANDSGVPKTTKKHVDKPECIKLGMVNAGLSRAFHIDAPRMEQALIWPEREAMVDLESSCQVTSLHYPTQHRFNISTAIGEQLESFDLKVTRAHWAGWEATLQQSISGQ